LKASENKFGRNYQMPTPIAPRITVPEEVYAILEKIVKAGKSEQRLVRRAAYILEMARGAANAKIAREFGAAYETVKKWRCVWLGSEEVWEVLLSEADEKKRAKMMAAKVREILSDERRSGAPLTYTPEQYCQILQVALESPSESGRPINNWTERELADEVKKRGIAGISPTQVGRFLKGERTKSAPESVLAESESGISRRVRGGNEGHL